jgi:putative flippase GtrA
MTPRWLRFVMIGILGFLLQLALLAVLTAVAGWTWLPATLVAVELTVVHNYLWHARWTWEDRPGGWLARFWRFQIGNGLASVAGNILLMAVFSGELGWPPVPANLTAVAIISVVNFVLADRWVFRRRVGGIAVVAAGCALCLSIPARASAQSTETIRAWDRHVAGAEQQVEQWRQPRGTRQSREGITTDGDSVRVPSGTISQWHGSMFVRGVTLDEVLHRLQYPGTPPPQEDVVSSQLLERADDSLRLSIRLVRKAIVTVTYDTEHEMRFHRWTPHLATARSVATRIQEEGGDDHGFLWRLHSYWRYEEVDGGVQIDLESLTLSRDVPMIIRPIAGPIITRIARESMVRTLEALQRFFNRDLSS